MKINKKLIAIGVASLGTLFSIGGAFALYTQAADNASFGISAGAYAGSGGTLTYKINNTTGNSVIAPEYLTTGGDNGGTGLSTTYTQVQYSMALGANFASGANAQDFVVGNLGVSITNIPEAYRGKLSIWVVIDGYEAASLGEATYKNVFMNSDYAITNENQSFTGNHDVAVSSSGTQVLHIYLKYNLESFDTLTQNEASLGYSLSVTWAAPSNEFEKAYVVGNGNQWTEDDGFSMAPNINKPNAEGFEWVYNNLPGSLGEGKCKKGETWSSGDNAPLNAEKSYNVYWSGSDSAAANFAEIGA